ncbi:MAG TPA: DUF3795 domain-containing protein [Methanocorpusculum sp.]|nr:DUF3795 domain-containing protein [Methanocorpusculum sp.]
MTEKMIAVCGLDCAKCKARIAAVNNDNELRKSFAKELSALNGVEISPEMINCEGCRGNGIKSYFCENICEIKHCVKSKQFKTCAECKELETCKTLRMLPGHSDEIIENLKNLRK